MQTYAYRALGWAAALAIAAAVSGCATTSNATATAPRYEIKRMQTRTLPAAELAALLAKATESAAAAAGVMEGQAGAQPVAN